LSKKLLLSITLLTIALCLALPASAQTTFFDDLGSGNDVYNCCSGWTISGTGSIGESFTAANEFTSLASGSVSQIDLGVGYVAGFLNQFYAAVYTDNNGLPGTELWTQSNLSSSQEFGSCCGLVSITGISGLTLTAGQAYFLVLGPESVGNDAYLAWNMNSTGATGLDLYSTNGGGSWNSNGQQTIGAFDILGGSSSTVPEPSSLLLLGTGLVGAFSTMRKKLMR
jgi:hypothetical protein